MEGKPSATVEGKAPQGFFVAGLPSQAPEAEEGGGEAGGCIRRRGRRVIGVGEEGGVVLLQGGELRGELERGGGTDSEAGQRDGVGAIGPAKDVADGGVGMMRRWEGLLSEGRAGGGEPRRWEEEKEGVQAVEEGKLGARGGQEGGDGDAEARVETGPAEAVGGRAR
jgi:hypothetical protein